MISFTQTGTNIKVIWFIPNSVSWVFLQKLILRNYVYLLNLKKVNNLLNWSVLFLLVLLFHEGIESWSQFTPYFFMVHYNITFPSISRSPSYYFPLTQVFLNISHRHVTSVSSSLSWLPLFCILSSSMQLCLKLLRNLR